MVYFILKFQIFQIIWHLNFFWKQCLTPIHRSGDLEIWSLNIFLQIFSGTDLSRGERHNEVFFSGISQGNLKSNTMFRFENEALSLSFLQWQSGGGQDLIWMKYQIWGVNIKYDDFRRSLLCLQAKILAFGYFCEYLRQIRKRNLLWGDQDGSL